MVFSPDQVFYGLNKSVGGDRSLPYISSFMGILIDIPCNLKEGLAKRVAGGWLKTECTGKAKEMENSSAYTLLQKKCILIFPSSPGEASLWTCSSWIYKNHI